MQVVTMKKSGRRLLLSDRKAQLFRKMGVAREDFEVVKSPPVKTVPAQPEPEPEPEKPKHRRRYKRRDMESEEKHWASESNESSNILG